jgi:hypothetical protein
MFEVLMIIAMAVFVMVAVMGGTDVRVFLGLSRDSDGHDGNFYRNNRPCDSSLRVPIGSRNKFRTSGEYLYSHFVMCLSTSVWTKYSC